MSTRQAMSTRQWLDSLTKEERDSFSRLGCVNYQICMALLRENGGKVGVEKRYSFVENMTR